LGKYSHETTQLVEKLDKAWWKRYRAEQSAHTVHDNIKLMERAAVEERKEKELPSYGTRVSYVFDCRSCGTHLPRACPSAPHQHYSHFAEGLVVDEPFACPQCGGNPHVNAEAIGLTVGTTFSPYFDISKGKNAKCPPGVYYAGPGVGHYIPTKRALHDFARMNGGEVR